MRVPLSVTHPCRFTKGSHVYLVQRCCAVSVVGEWAQPSALHPTCHASSCLSSFLTLSPREMYNYAGDNREHLNAEVAFQPLLLPLFRLNYSATLLEGLQHHIINI